MKPQTITVIVLIIVIACLAAVIAARENSRISLFEKFTGEIIEQDRRHLDNLDKFIENYNDLYREYRNLYRDYQELSASRGFYEGWEEYLCTAYTSLDPGTSSHSAIGLDIKKWSGYFNFCAFDPEGDIDYGDLVLIKFDTGTVPFLAVDCGYLIKDTEDDKRLDLYFVDNRRNAFRFGKKYLEVKVIK